MKLIEIISSVLFLVGIILKFTELPGSYILIMFSLSLLALYYFLFGFAIFNDIKIKNIFRTSRYRTNTFLQFIFSIFLGLSLSVILYGIMYKILRWSIQIDLLLIGLIITLTITVLYFLIIKGKISNKRIIFLRSLIVSIVGIITYIIF